MQRLRALLLNCTPETYWISLTSVIMEKRKKKKKKVFLSEAPEWHSGAEHLILMSEDISMGDVLKHKPRHRAPCHGGGPSLGGGSEGSDCRSRTALCGPGVRSQLPPSLLRAERWLMPAPISVTCAGSHL